MNMFISGGKLSTIRYIPTEEVLFWDISSACEKGKDKKYLKSPEFRFADATCCLFVNIHLPYLHFGIDVKIRHPIRDLFNYCCNVSYQLFNGEVYKSFELKFTRGESMGFITAEEVLNSNTLNELGNIIVCRIRSKTPINITNSGSSDSVEVQKIHWSRYTFAFEKVHDLHPSSGKVSDKVISTEEKELTWDISRYKKLELKSPEFRFAGGSWFLLVTVSQSHMIFGIHYYRTLLSDEVFDCCCNISCRNLKGEVFKQFNFKFTYDKKTATRLSMTDYFPVIDTLYSYLQTEVERGIVIVCRISSKKSTVKEACSLTGINYSSGSAFEVQAQIHQPENKDDEIPTVNFDCNVCQDLKKILDSGEGSDVTIQIGDQSFKAHMSILTARSSVFAAMLRHHMKEKATGVVDVKDCDASSFPVFLEFLYCGNTEKLSVDNVFSLYNTADKYDRQDLKMNCLQFLKINLTVETFCETIHLSLQHSETDLLNLATDFFARNMEEILITSKWQAFLLQNPIHGNEILIKALKSGRR